jgi:predicted lipoprotein with Yx(FWY)xxD motif
VTTMRALGPRSTLLVAAMVLALAAAVPVVRAAGGSATVVRVMKNAKLGKQILVNKHGRTLYHLSGERPGKFICTDKTCLSFWHPLVVAHGVKPMGATGLATTRRPDGRTQVTFKGGPLYTFVGDKKVGDVKGEGIKDVGVWHAASPSSKPAKSPSPPSGYPYPR